MHLFFKKILIFTIFNYVLCGENLLLKKGNSKRSLNYAGEINEAGIPIKTSKIFTLTFKDKSSPPENEDNLSNFKIITKEQYLHCKYYPNYVKCLEKLIKPNSDIKSQIPDVYTNSKLILKKHFTDEMPTANLHNRHLTKSLNRKNILGQILSHISRKNAALSAKKLYAQPVTTFKPTIKPETTNEKVEIYAKPPVFYPDYSEMKQLSPFQISPEFSQFSSEDMPKNSEFPPFPEREMPSMPKFPQFSEIGISSMPEYHQFSEIAMPSMPEYHQFSEIDMSNMPEYHQFSEIAMPSMPEYNQFSEIDMPNMPNILSFSEMGIPNMPKFPSYTEMEMPSVTKFLSTPEMEMPSIPQFPQFSEMGMPSIKKFHGFPENDFPNIPKLTQFSKLNMPNIPKFSASGFPSVPEKFINDDKFKKDMSNEFLRNQSVFERHKYSTQNGLNGLRKIKFYRDQFSSKKDDKVDEGDKSFLETFLYKRNPNNGTEVGKLFNVNSYTSVENN